MTVLHVAARAEQRVHLVEEQDRATVLGLRGFSAGNG